MRAFLYYKKKFLGLAAIPMTSLIFGSQAVSAAPIPELCSRVFLEVGRKPELQGKKLSMPKDRFSAADWLEWFYSQNWVNQRTLKVSRGSPQLINISAAQTIFDFLARFKINRVITEQKRLAREALNVGLASLNLAHYRHHQRVQFQSKEERDKALLRDLQLANHIRGEGREIYLFQELSDMASLSLLCSNELNGEYVPIMVSPMRYFRDMDKYGKNEHNHVGAIIKADFPFNIRVKDHSERKGFSMINGLSEISLYLKKDEGMPLPSQKPDIVLVVSHFNSMNTDLEQQRFGYNDRERSEQLVISFLEDLRVKYRDTPVLFAADFNANDFNRTDLYQKFVGSLGFIDPIRELNLSYFRTYIGRRPHTSKGVSNFDWIFATFVPQEYTTVDPRSQQLSDNIGGYSTDHLGIGVRFNLLDLVPELDEIIDREFD